ncbi:MAG: DeoR family transcriptional regulator, partial [Planctomycetes bacterium]|nr:DeoR family transcriptional regulator [Planctomycetota bacterium]
MTVSWLSSTLRVSLPTVRSDLRGLHSHGLLIRTHA